MSTAQMEKVVHHVRTLVTAQRSGVTDAQLLGSFLADNDQASFEALVRRHGPMVLAVCRRVLGNPHDAEDAFQATFLILIRKAGSLSRRELLANWLHGVAHRVALKARTAASRRRARELPVDDNPQTAVTVPKFPDDRLARLDQEIDRLPRKYRTPVVLCDLQGTTRADAAEKLGWPLGTLNWRLATGRKILAKRLGGAEMLLSGALAATLSPDAVSATVPQSLLTSTVKAAGGRVLHTGAISERVVALAEAMLKSVVPAKCKIGAAILLAVVLVGTGTGLKSGGPVPAGEACQPHSEKQVDSEKPVAEEGQADDLPPGVTANFRVEGLLPEAARKVGQAAEKYRKEKALEWLGRELPGWADRCPIRVRLTAGGAGAATSFAFDQGKVLQQSMNLEGPLEHLLEVDLPHEMTHVVLAHHFGTPIPRWADEGAAILSSADSERRRYDEQLRKVLAQPGRVIPLARLFPQMDYPADVMALHTEGYSVTRFLVEAKGRRTFLRFLAMGKSDGWDRAVQQYYGYSSVESLERTWRRSLADGTRSDAGLLRGRWVSTSWEEEGKPAPASRKTEFVLKFGDEELEMRRGLQVIGFRCRLVPDRSPRRIQLSVLGQKTEAIYRLDGDRLRVCLGRPGGPVPTRFATTKGDRNVLIVLERAGGVKKPPHFVKGSFAELEWKFERAFQEEREAIKKAPLRLLADGLVLEAEDFSDLEDGRVKLSPCWYASFEEGKATTFRCEEAYFTLDSPISKFDEMAKRKIRTIESTGRSRVTFQPATDAEASPSK